MTLAVCRELFGELLNLSFCFHRACTPNALAVLDLLQPPVHTRRLRRELLLHVGEVTHHLTHCLSEGIVVMARGRVGGRNRGQQRLDLFLTRGPLALLTAERLCTRLSLERARSSSSCSTRTSMSRCACASDASREDTSLLWVVPSPSVGATLVLADTVERVCCSSRTSLRKLAFAWQACWCCLRRRNSSCAYSWDSCTALRSSSKHTAVDWTIWSPTLAPSPNDSASMARTVDGGRFDSSSSSSNAA